MSHSCHFVPFFWNRVEHIVLSVSLALSALHVVGWRTVSKCWSTQAAFPRLPSLLAPTYPVRSPGMFLYLPVQSGLQVCSYTYQYSQVSRYVLIPTSTVRSPGMFLYLPVQSGLQVCSYTYQYSQVSRYVLIPTSTVRSPGMFLYLPVQSGL